VAVLDSRADRAAEEYAANRGRMEALVSELRERTAQVATERSPETVERHATRGKLLARERVERLLDPGSAFLELNALAAWDV
jgi:3-methylcrotonyl-CoA carboxylase beta subunit